MLSSKPIIENWAISKTQLQVQNKVFEDYIKVVKGLKSKPQVNPLHIAELVYKETHELTVEVEKQEKMKLKIEKERDTLKTRIEAETEKIQNVKKKCEKLRMETETTKLETELEKKQNKMLQEKIDFLKKLYEKRIAELQTLWKETKYDVKLSTLIEDLNKLRNAQKSIRLEIPQEKMDEMMSDINALKEKLLFQIHQYKTMVVGKIEVDTEIKVYEMLLDEEAKWLDEIIHLHPNPDGNFQEIQQRILQDLHE